MARTHIVKKAQKDQGYCMSPTCSHEDKAIKVGDSYKHFTLRFGGKKVYHTDCNVPGSHTTASAQLGTIYDAQETASQALGSINAEDANADWFMEVAQAAADAIREAGEMYSESADNMESGFGTSTSISDEIREKGEGCESWADEIESAAQDIEDFDEDDARQDAENEHDAEDYEEESEREQAIEDEINTKRDDWFSEAVSAIEDAINNQPF
jgi:hypothetical protein